MATPDFWASLGAFTIVARAAEKGLNVGFVQKALPRLLRGAARAAIPLAAGMAAIDLLHGQADPLNVAISTGSFLVAGFAVSSVMDAVLYPVLFAAGPPGWVGAAAYTVIKLALTLYLGEKIEAGIHAAIEGGRNRSYRSVRRKTARRPR